ncbi:MAG: isoprenylcysteine carboxylmethyltransferase family protein [Chloroflexia bacterium]
MELLFSFIYIALPPGVPSMEWQILFTLLLGLWVALEIFIGKLGLSAESIISDRGSALAVIITGVGAIALATSVRLRWGNPIGGEWVQWLGLLVMALGLLLRYGSIRWLGPMFTRFVQVLPDHKLVTNGPYSLVRHPAYTGLLVFFIGMGIALGDWLSLLFLTLIPPIGIIYRIKVEEQALLEAFGEEYRAYMGRTYAIFPLLL